MLPLLNEINEKIEKYIMIHSSTNEGLELKYLMGKFSMDALASCAFGVDSGSFTNENSEFIKAANKVFDFVNPWAILKNVIAIN